MKNKLVTLIGGGGFLGRYVAQDLLAAGARVRIAQRDPRAALFLKPQGGLGQTQFVAVDVRKPESIARAVAGADAVVNLVGILKGDFSAIQAEGAKTVAEVAASAGVGALVHVSAIGSDAESASGYGRSKAAGEAAVRAAFSGATIMRPSIIFGREDGFINRFAGMIAGPMPLLPVLRAGAKFQPVFVGDVAAAIVAALAHPDTAAGKTFELGGPDIVTMGGLIRWIATTIGRDPTIVELPDAVGGMIALGGFLPGAPITRDQWRMLQVDNVVAPGAATLADLGVAPTPLDSVAPGWLVQYRRHGRFTTTATA
ncbi:complex I NDUFA9 subunit family protein [Sphingomonas sp. AR_OL41]|uniref:complex I NDUFA9 subunit family protein n=1 Tax=Sphingomonas sp. AR_OL41 TaxID=3042729 RepID=UPI0024801A6A|nr:complex I NDUFA9 subunit family protein [Sphingomonas sp. AR_OL41]MDH7972130.1 complex I NDUFA9 subunit family protein [Sphingomonas sp. AR_OL41]